MAGVGTVTLLFTDLVGSTALASSLGDVEVDRIRRAHFATLRAASRRPGVTRSRTSATDSSSRTGVRRMPSKARSRCNAAVDPRTRTRRSTSRSRSASASVTSPKTTATGSDAGQRTPRACAQPRGRRPDPRLGRRPFAGRFRARHAMRPSENTRATKGLPEPLAVCVVEWTRAQESLDLPLPPGFVAGREIVGRDAELALVLDIWRAARHGTAATVLVGGEPGIGKTAPRGHRGGCRTRQTARWCSSAAATKTSPRRTARGSRPCGTSCSASTRRRFGTGPASAPRELVRVVPELSDTHRRSRAALDRGSGVGAVRVPRGRHRAPHRCGRGEAVAARAR